MSPHHKYKFIISGGGTGGHIFPALAIADELKRRHPDCAIHFVGAQDRMEMEKIPQHGYTITGIPISGLNRQKLLKNIWFPFKLLKSIAICRILLKSKKPDAVIGTGGFASGPLLWQAQRNGTPTVIQEQNSYPGITNKLLAKKAKAICVAYDGLEKWFPENAIIKTGNPVRATVFENTPDQGKARSSFGLNPNKKTILVLGGSLGARAINQAIEQQLPKLLENDTQILWQCGKLYINAYKKHAADNVHVTDFIQDMAAAFASADIIISRAGAGTISELCIMGKPVILVPSPNVAEDHQTHNAKALSSKKAAILLPETELALLHETAKRILASAEEQKSLEKNINELALPDATKTIVDQIEKLLT